ncbi:MAG: 2-dehydropantoate 2-reductase [Bradyrhizobiaceae bacterium]|nr:MAG: 2-dehydropantoate 2-reductase [Bradyrhizobiaceae bacterium]
MKIAIMGAGAVGGYFGAMLARAGHDVVLIARPQHVEAIARQGGLMIEARDFHGVVPLRATADPSGVEGAELVLFCVKSGDTQEAGRSIAPHLASGATVLCLQNGVDNAERLQATIKQPAVPAAVYVAAEMAGPGHINHRGRGELIIGASPASADIAACLSAASIPTHVSDRVMDDLWTKLVMNCALNALSAVAQLPYGRVIEVEGVSSVIRNVVDECTAVAAALGISVPKDAYDKVLALPSTMPEQFSSTAQDLARGKPSEIDYLNGYVARKGAELSIPAPANLALQVMVKLCEAAAR